MEITKLSASAMEVAELCLSRWDADNKAGRIGQESGIPAMVGSACHGGAQGFVEQAILTDNMDRSWKTLEVLYMKSYMGVFGNLDVDSATYKDGLALLKKWFARTSWDGFKVLMVEEKLNFMVPTGRLNPDGTKEEIPFNFIFDRFDQMDEPDVFRVVDYKTLSQPLSPMDLHDKIQPRVYGLAAQILHPEATKIWVGFDMWRWESPIETFYTREDNIATWNRIKAAAKKIRDFDPDEIDPRTGEPQGIPETLNSNCGWCIRKTTCNAVAANVKSGGVFLYPDLQSRIDARALLKMQAKAAGDAVKELDKLIMADFKEMDITEFETNLMTAKAVSRGQRSINPEHVRAIAGEALFQKYGEAKINMKDFDALLADPELPPSARARLESSITKEYGEPYISTDRKKPKK